MALELRGLGVKLGIGLGILGPGAYKYIYIYIERERERERERDIYIYMECKILQAWDLGFVVLGFRVLDLGFGAQGLWSEQARAKVRSLELGGLGFWVP